MSDCKRCKGEGYVLDRAVALLTGGFVPLISWLTDDGDTKDHDMAYSRCERCKGTGEEP